MPLFQSKLLGRGVATIDGTRHMSSSAGSIGFLQTSKMPVTQGPAHPQMVSNAGHEPGLSDKVKLQPDLGRQLIHWRGQIESELRPLQKEGSPPDLDQISSHGWQSSRVLNLDRHQPLRPQSRELLLGLCSVNLHSHVKFIHTQRRSMGTWKQTCSSFESPI